jgi:hypothetical protein
MPYVENQMESIRKFSRNALDEFRDRPPKLLSYGSARVCNLVANRNQDIRTASCQAQRRETIRLGKSAVRDSEPAAPRMRCLSRSPQPFRRRPRCSAAFFQQCLIQARAQPARGRLRQRATRGRCTPQHQGHHRWPESHATEHSCQKNKERETNAQSACGYIYPSVRRGSCACALRCSTKSTRAR